MSGTCPGCGCARTDAPAIAVHAVITALADDDLDRAIESGLLSPINCDACTVECTATLLAARLRRLQALAARERYLARNARLQRRAQERAVRRDAPPEMAQPVTVKPALPPAAAEALARAKAKAAERGTR